MKWHLVTVYGPAQNEHKDHFLAELGNLFNRCYGKWVIRGDFNIIRKTTEKNNINILSKWSHLFNSIIEVSGLKELKLIGLII